LTLVITSVLHSRLAYTKSFVEFMRLHKEIDNLLVGSSVSGIDFNCLSKFLKRNVICTKSCVTSPNTDPKLGHSRRYCQQKIAHISRSLEGFIFDQAANGVIKHI